MASDLGYPLLRATGDTRQRNDYTEEELARAKQRATEIAKGSLLSPFTWAPDLMGMIGRASMNIPSISAGGRAPELSGDPIRRAWGLDPDSGWGMIGEFLDPTAMAAKAPKAMTLAAKLLGDTPMLAAALPAITRAGKGGKKVKLVHYSRNPDLKEVDPKFYGTGSAGAERKLKEQWPEYWVDRSYYGANADMPGGYLREPVLGSVRYETEVDADKLYDLANDPLNIFGSLDESIPGPARTVAAEKQLADQGFEGYQIGNTVALFEKKPVTKVERFTPPPLLAAPTGTRVAEDVGRVDFPEGQVIPKAKARSEFSGAPKASPLLDGRAVESAADEQVILDSYLNQVESGAAGRNWYETVSKIFNKEVGNLSGAREGAADRSASVFGEFSPRTAVKANRLAQVRANNQFATGRDVAAGTGPRNRAAQQVLETGEFPAGDKLKVGVFSMQSRGLPEPRGVHDFRDAINFGFNPDDTISVAQHRWMDTMADRAVEEANRRKLGGHTDWTHEKLQAASWVKQKADDLGIKPEDLIDEIGAADETLIANIFSEATPSKELHKLHPEQQGGYTLVHQSRFANPEGQDAVAQQLGLLSPESRITLGEWQNNWGPNIVTRIMADPGVGTDVISDWSSEAVGFHAALRGLLGGQADVASSFFRRPKKVGDINSAVIPFNRDLDPKDFPTYKAAFDKSLRENNIPGEFIVNARGRDGLEVTWLEPFDDEGFQLTKSLAEEGLQRKAAKRTIAQKGAIKEMQRINRAVRDTYDTVSNGRAVQGKNVGAFAPGGGERQGLLTFADTFKPSNYLDALKNPKMRAAVSGVLPKIAADIRKDLELLPLTERGKEVYMKTIELIESGGIDAVEKAVKSGTLPAAILGAVLAAASQAPQQRGQARETAVSST